MRLTYEQLKAAINHAAETAAGMKDGEKIPLLERAPRESRMAEAQLELMLLQTRILHDISASMESIADSLRNIDSTLAQIGLRHLI